MSASVRMCKRHLVTLDEEPAGDGLACPAGRHRIGRREPFLVVAGGTRRILYEATLEQGALRMGDERETAKTAETAERKTKARRPKTLQAAKFEHGDQILILRLRYEPTKAETNQYRVRWQTGAADLISHGRGTTQGASKSAPDAPRGREAFASEVAAAMKDGWKRVPMRETAGRALALRPIPKPGKAAKR